MPVLLLLLLPLAVAHGAADRFGQDVPESATSASMLELDRRASRERPVRREDPVDELRRHHRPKIWSETLAGSFIVVEAPKEIPARPAAASGQTTLAVSQEPDGTQWIAVYVLVVMILVAISPIAVKEGVRPFCTVVIYLACLSLVKMYVKATMNAGFGYPDSITATHMLCTAFVACLFERPRLTEAWVVLPISVVNGASLLTNNTAMLYGGVAFVSMVSSCTPMFTFMLELFKRRRSLDFLTAFSVLLVCAGSAFCVRGEKAASLLSLVFACAGSLLRAMRGVWQHELLSISVSPMRMVFWSGFWSFWITLSMVFANEKGEALEHFSNASNEAKVSFFFSIISAIALNISQCYAVKQLGALLQSIVGNLNLILVIVLSQAWLHEKVTPWQYVGVTLLAAGTFFNKYGDMQRKATQAKDKRTESQVQQSIERAPEAGETYGSMDDGRPPVEAAAVERREGVSI
mmetsp:Transcript_31183/g.72049  ORF Transcript_31183/g.72049 Transcript_31183/m.72049 type:complete len:463 (-) Transcript_31183:68-1456(-)